MDRRIFHGDLKTEDFAIALVAQFHRGNYSAQSISSQGKDIVQVATLQRPVSGGQTALTVYLEQVEDGIAVQIGEQAWLGVAASLGTTILSVWRNPFNLINRLDDIAQDVESLQITEQVWQVIENVARMKGALFELSERLRRLTCEYCGTANPVGEPSCIACGAPLGKSQPSTCPNCGYVVTFGEKVCPNCNFSLGGA
jgi:DNA-directed RNA polymerase subunit RPC12/RpoP